MGNNRGNNIGAVGGVGNGPSLSHGSSWIGSVSPPWGRAADEDGNNSFPDDISGLVALALIPEEGSTDVLPQLGASCS